MINTVLDKLPRKPYCCDNLASGLIIRSQKIALKYRYIQLNHMIVNYLIFDIDRPKGALAWEDANVATPNLAVINKKNQHAHLIYFLAAGVPKFPNSSLKALRYLAAVEAAYTKRLGADFGYAGLIAKNPLNPFWKTWNIHGNKYDLSELADYVDLPIAGEIENIQTGIGRNCDLFENGRKWAYKAVRDFREDNYQNFLSAAYNQLLGFNNNFLSPLPSNEVFSTAKSISKWTWRHDKEAYDKFIARQKFKSGLASEVRIDKSMKRAKLAIKLKQEGYSAVTIAKAMGLSVRQVYNYLS